MPIAHGGSSGDHRSVIGQVVYTKWRVIPSQRIEIANKAMHTELAAVPNSLYHVTRANRVIANVMRRRSETRMSLRSCTPWILMLVLAGCSREPEPVLPFTETLPLEFGLLDPLILLSKVDAAEWRGGIAP